MMQISKIKCKKSARNKPARPIPAGRPCGGGAEVIDIAPYLVEKELRELGKKLLDIVFGK